MATGHLKAWFFITGILLALFPLYRAYRKGNVSAQSLTLLLTGALLLRISTSLDPFLHEWDERYHALVAKNMARDFFTPKLYPKALLQYDYRSWSDNYIWLHKQPFPLWTMGLSVKCFGAGELAVRLPSILLSTCAVYFTFLIGSWLFSRRAGFIAAFFHAVNGLIIEITGGRVATDHIDVFFLVFIELGILLSVLHWKRYPQRNGNHFWLLFAIGASTGIAILCKWLPALIVVPVFLILHYNNKGKWAGAAIILSSAILVFMPWQVYAALKFPKEYWYEMQYNTRHIFEALENHARPWYYHFDTARIIWNELIYIPLLWLIYRVLKNREQQFVLLAIWIFIPYFFFTFAETKMAGYVLFTGPAIFILEAVFILQIIETKRFRTAAFITGAGFFILALRYCAERVKPFSVEREGIKKCKEIKDLTLALNSGGAASSRAATTVLFNNPLSIETMFYTDMISYERLPAPEEVQYLLNRNYQVIIFEGENLSDDLKGLNGVQYYKRNL